jgi:hypothetical protein
MTEHLAGVFINIVDRTVSLPRDENADTIFAALIDVMRDADVYAGGEMGPQMRHIFCRKRSRRSTGRFRRAGRLRSRLHSHFEYPGSRSE